MNRILRGAVVLAASALALGCNTEPEETEGGTPTAIVADPEVIFIERGDSQTVLVRLVDQQGTSLNSPITISGAAAPIAISIDSLFRPIFAPDGTLIANTNGTELRLFVRGDGLGATQFTVSAGGFSENIAVTVTPTNITPAASTLTPGIGELVTLTAEAGLTFSPTSQVVDAAGALVGETMSVAPDGTTMTVTFIPGASPTFRITDVVPAYAPSLTLTLESAVQVAATTTPVGLAGVDAPGTAPSLLPLTLSVRSGVVDVGTVYPGTSSGFGTRFYKLEVVEGGIYDFVATWEGGEDLGFYFVDPTTGDVLEALADDHGAGATASPEEHLELELEPGTYIIGVLLFDGADPEPAFFQMSFVAHE